MLTSKQRRFLEALHRYLKDNPQYSFSVQGRERLVLSFPYGAKTKDVLAKDRKNFDYQIDAIFNHKLREAMLLVVYINSLFPEATETTKRIVVERLRRRQK